MPHSIGRDWGTSNFQSSIIAVAGRRSNGATSRQGKCSHARECDCGDANNEHRSFSTQAGLAMLVNASPMNTEGQAEGASAAPPVARQDASPCARARTRRRRILGQHMER